MIHKVHLAAAAAKSLQSCPTLCDPIDGSPPGSVVPGILRARTLEWIAISSSNAWKGKVKVKSLSPVWLLATPWTAAYQAPPSMGFSRQEYWSGVPLPSPSELHKGTLLSEDQYNHGVSNWMVRVRQQLLEVLGHRVGKLIAIGRETDKPLCDLCHPWSKDGNTTSWV